MSAAEDAPSPPPPGDGRLSYDPGVWDDLSAVLARVNLCERDTTEKAIIKDLLQVLLLKKNLGVPIVPLRPERQLYDTVRNFNQITADINAAKPLWTCCPSNILVLKKHNDVVITGHLRNLVTWLLSKVDSKIHVEAAVYQELSLEQIPNNEKLHSWSKVNADIIDFVILLGGDGTLLHMATLFQGIVPPVLCFALGSLGFLTPFPFRNFDDTLKQVIDGTSCVSMRMRLQCEIRKHSVGSEHPKVHPRDGSNLESIGTFHVLNEVVLDRGPTPYVTRLEIFCDGNIVTTLQGDGLIIATPTGSTAYSVAAGGSMVHPELSCFLITPICPHSLSFRPIIVPSTVTLEVRVTSKSAWVSMDGRNQHELAEGERIKISLSPFPVPTISRLCPTEDWFLGLSQCLSWNARESAARLNLATP